MKAFVLAGGEKIENLALASVPAAGGIAQGQVRVGVRAVSLNYRDLLTITGGLGRRLPDGFIPCSDAAGEILEAAPDVAQFAKGDRVALTFNPDWIGGAWRPTAGALGRGSAAIPGVMREEIVAHHSELVRLPAHLDFVEGATLPCAAVTAWHALCGAGPLYPGMSVLLQGGGGVSVFALQFAKLFGARTIMITSSPERCRRLQELGADEVIDYRRTEAWNVTVRELTGGMGVDLAVEVGGAQTVDRSFAATRVGGRVALVGRLTGQPQISTSMLAASVDITSIKVGSREDLESLARAIGFHRVKPVVDRIFPFDQFPDALRYLQSGQHMGKIVIKFGSTASK